MIIYVLIRSSYLVAYKRGMDNATVLYAGPNLKKAKRLECNVGYNYKTTIERWKNGEFIGNYYPR